MIRVLFCTLFKTGVINLELSVLEISHDAMLLKNSLPVEIQAQEMSRAGTRLSILC
jgi:hypothetical protein